MKGSLSPLITEMLAQGEPISRKEEERLGKILLTAKDPDAIKQAKDRIILANVRYMVKMCLTEYYVKPPITYDDLISEGVDGLYEALKRYDYRLGMRFMTYAKQWVRQRVNGFLSKNITCVKVPSGTLYQLDKIRQTCNDSMQIMGCEVDLFKEASRMNLDPLKLQAAEGSLSYSEYGAVETAGMSFVDFNVDDVMSTILEGQIEDEVKKLDFRTRDIICRRYGIKCSPYTLREIGMVHMLSRERVRQILKNAEKKIRGRLTAPPNSHSDNSWRSPSRSPYPQSSKLRSSVGSGSCIHHLLPYIVRVEPATLYLYPIKQEIKERA